MFRQASSVLLLLSLLLPWEANAEDQNSQLTGRAQQEIIRAISSEHATLKVALPINKRGLTLDKNGKFDWKKNEEALLYSGQFIAIGIQIRITKVDFKKDKLVFELNGGGKKKKRILERIYVGTGSSVTPLARTLDPSNPQGSYLTIKFDKFVPNITPEKVRFILSSVLDFSRKSSIKTFIETFPKEFREAVKNKRAALGMDRDMVLTSMGLPLRRIRESTEQGQVEEWIYGERPRKIIFVKFQEGVVVSIKEY